MSAAADDASAADVSAEASSVAGATADDGFDSDAASKAAEAEANAAAAEANAAQEATVAAEAAEDAEAQEEAAAQAKADAQVAMDEAAQTQAMAAASTQTADREAKENAQKAAEEAAASQKARADYDNRAIRSMTEGLIISNEARDGAMADKYANEARDREIAAEQQAMEEAQRAMDEAAKTARRSAPRTPQLTLSPVGRVPDGHPLGFTKRDFEAKVDPVTGEARVTVHMNQVKADQLKDFLDDGFFRQDMPAEHRALMESIARDVIDTFERNFDGVVEFARPSNPDEPVISFEFGPQI